MKKIYLLIISTFLLCSQLFAQIHVDSFEKLVTGEALMNQRKDHNGEVCALIKITTKNLDDTQRKRIQFYSDATTQILDLTYPVGAIQFYISPAAEYLEIAHPDLSVTKYVFKEIIESKRDYAMVISTDIVTTVVQKRITENYLVVTTEPADAQIYINGEFAGIGEVSKFLSILSEHTYRIEAPLFHTQEGKVKLTEKETTTLEIKLLPASGFINVTSTPESGAQVLIDGKIIGNTPIKSDRIASGTHAVKVLKDMYQPVTKMVTVADGETVETKIDLPANFAEPTITTDADAEIWINNEQKATGRWNGRLATGTYLFEARKPSHRPSQQTVTLKAGDKQTINLSSPTPIYGTLNINTTPIGATISIDGKDFGKTPKIINDILVGSHSVRLSKNDFLSLTKTITIEEGEIKKMNETLQKGEDATLTQKPATPKTQTQRPPKEKSKEKGNFLLGINAAYSLSKNPALSYELYAGYAKKVGGYLKLKSNFNIESTKEITGDIETLPEGETFTVGKATTKRFGIVGGVYIRVAKPVYVYVGAGYGSRMQILQDYRNGVSNITTYSANTYKSVEIDAGFTFKINKFTISVGAACIKKYFEANIGIGLML